MNGGALCAAALGGSVSGLAGRALRRGRHCTVSLPAAVALQSRSAPEGEEDSARGRSHMALPAGVGKLQHGGERDPR